MMTRLSVGLRSTTARIILILLLLLISASYLTPSQHHRLPFFPTGTNIHGFSLHKHGHDYGLSEAQCTAFFPKLYTQINHSIHLYEPHPITRASLGTRGLENQRNLLRAMIHTGSLYVLPEKNDLGTRTRATLLALHRALTAYPDRASLPNVEFVISEQDPGPFDGPVWGNTKKFQPDFDDVWLMPEFGYYSWPETKAGAYSEIRRGIAEVEDQLPFEEKTRKLLWRGAPMNPRREAFLEATNDKPWADVHPLVWADKEDLARHRLTIPEHCRYAFVAHMSGLSWSGQGKYMHNCRSVFITHHLEWLEIYSDALVASGPDQNYVQAEDDWSDLASIMHDLLEHPDKAKRIADNSARELRDRYMVPGAEACYWRALIRGYAEVSFEPAFYEQDNRTWRGVPVESFMLMGTTTWVPD